ncbi:MAG: BamA/TamA family outer membrane protein [Azoarcus sp.]|jgi:translocation and assembly module TamA|nr:BamA/TamA family outer membrane protein [Azoarcus sp.]
MNPTLRTSFLQCARLASWRAGLWALVFAGPFFCMSATAGDGVTVELESPPEVRALLKQYVRLLRMDADSIPAAGPDRAALVRRTRREVADLLATEGYFASMIRIDRADAAKWRLVVEPGARATIVAVDIRFQGEIGADGHEAYREKLRSEWTMPVDAPFRQADWESAKQALLYALRGERYAAAKFASTRADVDSDAARVRLDVVIDSGPTFYLGALDISGLHDLPPDFIARYNTLREGGAYKKQDLLAFQESLQTAPQLSVAVVSIDPDPQKAAAVPVRVAVTEAIPQRLGFGLGFSSNTGYRVETSYRHVNLFGRGWELASGLRLEQRRQSVYADFFLPPEQARRRDSAGVSFDRSDLEGLKISTGAVGVLRSIRHDDIETQLATRVQREEIRPDDADKSSYNTLTMNWSWVQRAVDNVLDPRRGHVLEVQLGGGAGLSAQAHNFTRVYGRYQHYFTFGKRNVLTLRGEGGMTLAETRDGVPQDFLFRAGGTQSVRGYAYHSLGVTEGTATVGGRYLVTGSAELVRWIKPSTGLALFIDSGDAADSKDSFRAHTGYGFGGRWLSPAGPLAVDLAWARGERRPRLHFGVSVAF